MSFVNFRDGLPTLYQNTKARMYDFVLFYGNNVLLNSERGNKEKLHISISCVCKLEPI